MKYSFLEVRFFQKLNLQGLIFKQIIRVVKQK